LRQSSIAAQALNFYIINSKLSFIFPVRVSNGCLYFIAIISKKEDEGSVGEGQGTSNAIMASFYIKQVNDFLGGDVRCLLRSVSPEEEVQRHEELLDIFEQAGELATRLWSQKTSMKLLWASDFKDEMSLFSADSAFMEAHSTMGCASDDHAFDGTKIDLVLVPTLVVFGNNEGRGYEVFKPWMKSTVLVFDESTKDKQIEVDKLDRPQKRVKVEHEDNNNNNNNNNNMFATTAFGQPATKLPMSRGWRAGHHSTSRSSAPQPQLPDVKKKASSHGLSPTDALCPPVPTNPTLLPGTKSQDLKQDANKHNSGGQTKLSSKQLPTDKESIVKMQQTEADAKPQSPSIGSKNLSSQTPLHKPAEITTTTITPSKRRRQQKRQKKKNARRKQKKIDDIKKQK